MKIAHRYTHEQTLNDLHDADGHFFFRRQTKYGIHWELARFSDGVSNEQAKALIKAEGYYRFMHDDGVKFDYLPVRVVEPTMLTYHLIEDALKKHFGE